MVHLDRDAGDHFHADFAEVISELFWAAVGSMATIPGLDPFSLIQAASPRWQRRAACSWW